MDFLSNLRVGSRVGVKDKSPYPNPSQCSVEVIECETESYWIVNGIKFLKSNGLSYPPSEDMLLCSVSEAEERMNDRVSKLKVGDKVGLEDRSSYPYFYRYATIERETPKFWVVNEKKYSKVDCWGYGDRHLRLCSLTEARLGMEKYKAYVARKKKEAKEKEYRGYAYQLSCEYSEEFVTDLESVFKKHSLEKTPSKVDWTGRENRLRIVY